MSNVPSIGYESVHLSLNSAGVMGLTYTDAEAQLHNNSYNRLAVSCLGSIGIYTNMISFTDLTGRICDMPIDPVSPNVLITTGKVPENTTGEVPESGLKVNGLTSDGVDSLTGESGSFGVCGKSFVHDGQEQLWVQYYDTRLVVPFRNGVDVTIYARSEPKSILVLTKQRQKLKY